MTNKKSPLTPSQIAEILNAYYAYKASLDKPLNNGQSKDNENDAIKDLDEQKLINTIFNQPTSTKNPMEPIPFHDLPAGSITNILPNKQKADNLKDINNQPEDVYDEGHLLPGELEDYPSEDDIAAANEAQPDEPSDAKNTPESLPSLNDLQAMEQTMQSNQHQESALTTRTKQTQPERLGFDQRFNLEIDHVHTVIDNHQFKPKIRYRVIAKRSQQEMNNLTIDQVYQLIWLLQK